MSAHLMENPLPGSTNSKPYEHPVIFEDMIREMDPVSVIDGRDLESYEVAILAEAYVQKKNADPIPPETEEEFIHYEKIDKDYHSATDPFDGAL